MSPSAPPRKTKYNSFLFSDDVANYSFGETTPQKLELVPVKFQFPGTMCLKRISLPAPLSLVKLRRCLTLMYPQHADLFTENRIMTLLIQHTAASKHQRRKQRKIRQQQRRLLMDQQREGDVDEQKGDNDDQEEVATERRTSFRTQTSFLTKTSKRSARVDKRPVEVVQVTTSAGFNAALHRSRVSRRVLRFDIPQLPEKHACELCGYTPTAKKPEVWECQLQEHINGKTHRQRVAIRRVANAQRRKRIADYWNQVRALKLSPFGYNEKKGKSPLVSHSGVACDDEEGPWGWRTGRESPEIWTVDSDTEHTETHGTTQSDRDSDTEIDDAETDSDIEHVDSDMEYVD